MTMTLEELRELCRKHGKPQPVTDSAEIRTVLSSRTFDPSEPLDELVALLRWPALTHADEEEYTYEEVLSSRELLWDLLRSEELREAVSEAFKPRLQAGE